MKEGRECTAPKKELERSEWCSQMVFSRRPLLQCPERRRPTLPGKQSTIPGQHLQAQRDHPPRNHPETKWRTGQRLHSLHIVPQIQCKKIIKSKPGCKKTPVVSEGTVKGQLIALGVRGNNIKHSNHSLYASGKNGSLPRQLASNHTVCMGPKHSSGSGDRILQISSTIKKTTPLCCHTPFQDGGYACSPRHSKPQRLVDTNRSKGCIF